VLFVKPFMITFTTCEKKGIDMEKHTYKNPVFFVSAIIVTLLVLAGAIYTDAFKNVANTLFNFTTFNFGWFYLMSVFIFVLFLLVLSIAKYGKLRLGPKGSRPEYPFFTCIGMLFSAGFGAGLVFWGVAEPMSHFFETPFSDVEAQTEEGARVAMG